MPATERKAGLLPAIIIDDCGRNDYTDAGYADADLTSAQMALRSVLTRDLTPSQRRDFTAALRWTTRAAMAVSRHIDCDYTNAS